MTPAPIAAANSGRDTNPAVSDTSKPAGSLDRATPSDDGIKPCLLIPRPTRVAIYARISTADGRQNLDTQIRALREVGEKLGWNIVEVFTDEGISGSLGRDRRPGLDRLLKGVTRKQFELIASWSVCRLGRSLQDLLTILGDLHAKNVGLYLHCQGLDTTTPSGRAMYQMLGVFSEFEKAMIVDRIKMGIARVRAEGKIKLGRPGLSAEIRQRITSELRAGTPVRAISRMVGVAPASVRRIRKQLAVVSS